MKKIKSKIFILLAVSVLTVGLLCNAFLSGSAPVEEAKAAAPLYTVEEVKTALLAYEQTGNAGALLKDIMLPATSGTKTPKLDERRILNTTPLSAFGNAETYYKELRSHGIRQSDLDGMNYSDYQQLRNGWKLDPSTAKTLKLRFPELAEADLTQWTYGTYDFYLQEQNVANLKELFTEDQLAQLEKMGIQISDTQYLLRIYDTPANLLAQPEAKLKATIEDRYQQDLNLLLGADWRISAKGTF